MLYAWRFSVGCRGKITAMRLFLWPGLVAAVALSAVDEWLLENVSRESDPESLTAGWIIFGGPWSFVAPRIWLVALLNGFTLYILIVLGFAAWRSYKKYSRPPEWPDS
jgi:chromate transport protein ChrA